VSIDGGFNRLAGMNLEIVTSKLEESNQ